MTRDDSCSHVLCILKEVDVHSFLPTASAQLSSGSPYSTCPTSLMLSIHPDTPFLQSSSTPSRFLSHHSHLPYSPTYIIHEDPNPERLRHYPQPALILPPFITQFLFPLIFAMPCIMTSNTTAISNNQTKQTKKRSSLRIKILIYIHIPVNPGPLA